MGLREVPPRQRASASLRQVDGRKPADVKAHAAGSRVPRHPPRRPPVAARIAELECDLAALELTVLRRRELPPRRSPTRPPSILKLRGSQIQQDVLELMVDIAGPASRCGEPGRREPRVGTPVGTGLSQLPQGLDLWRVQRGPAIGHSGGISD